MFRTINEQIQVHYCDFVNSQTMKGFSDKNQARVIQRPIIMNGHVGDACSYRIFQLNFNRQEIKRTFHPIREKKKLKGKAPLQQ